MSSIQSHLDDIANAKEVVGSPAQRHALSTDGMERLKAFLLADSYAFTEIVAGHTDLIPEYHMPLSYAATGSTDKLIWVLTQSGFESYVIDQFRKEFAIRDILISRDRQLVDEALDWVSFRWSRGTFKSSVVTHGGATFTATNNPNSTARIIHAIDEKAWEFCEQIAATILSGTYRDLFPERLPPGKLNEQVTMKHITLGGRNIPSPQTTIQAGGYKSKDIAAHYDVWWVNDLVVGGEGGNATPVALPGVHGWLKSMTGFFMPMSRIRRRHEGNKWDDDDDDTWLTSGARARACLTIRVPIEVHDGEVVNILQRGTPTLPKLYPAAKIQQLQDSVLSDESDADGAKTWRCNYLLDPGAGGARIFPAAIVDDRDRWWMGPYEHPKAAKHAEFKERFLVARYKRDKEGYPVYGDKDARLAGKRIEPPKGENFRTWSDWRTLGKIVIHDPWVHLDRVGVLDPAWEDGGNNWAASIVGADSDMVMMELHTLSDTTGLDGWVEAVLELDARYKPRVWGFDNGAYQDAVIKNLMKTDKRLRRIRNRFEPVQHRNATKLSRMKAGLGEPLKMHRFLLDPSEGGQATRDELKKVRGVPKEKNGIPDALSMAPAVLRRRKSKEEQEEQARQIRAQAAAYRRSVDPALGVPLVA
jgi:hypothetical protein